MAKITEIAFFAYAVSDMKKARAFYEGVLGLVPNKEYPGTDPADVYVEYDIGPTTIAIGKSDMFKPSSDGASAAFEVDDFKGFEKMLRDKKVKISMEPQDFPTCSMMMIQDPDGNKMAIHHRKNK